MGNNTRSSFEDKPPKAWTIEEVADWARKELNFNEQDQAALKSAKINGSLLLYIDDHQDLATTLHLPFGSVIRLWTGIGKLTSLAEPAPEKLDTSKKRKREDNLADNNKLSDKVDHVPKRLKLDYFAMLKQALEGIEKQCVSDLKLPDFKQAETEHMEQLKTIFGDNIKQSIFFNPLMDRCADIRFMPRSVNDPVYKFMEMQSKKPGYHIYTLRAISGAGKTGTILNAIGRNAYLIYIQGENEEGRTKGDYLDEAFQLFRHCIKSFQHSAQYCTILAQAFWLARLRLLKHLKSKLTPAEWLFWCNTEGMRTINKIQHEFALCIDSHFGDNPTLLANLTYLIRETVGELGFVWFGVDEAQIIQNVSCGNDTSKRDLLKIMVLDALPSAKCSVVVAGKKKIDFSSRTQHGGAKGNNWFDLETSAINTFPYVKSTESLAILEKYFDLSDIDNEVKENAAKLLQGRLRYVVRVIGIMFQQARDCSTKVNMSKLLNESLDMLQSEIKDFIDERLESMTSTGNNSQAHLILLHITNVMVSSINNSNFAWDPKDFHKRFGFEPDDTGFFFFEKTDNEGKHRYCYQYMIKEPQVLDLLLENKQLQKFALKNNANDNKIAHEKHIDE